MTALPAPPVWLDSRAICQRFTISMTTLWRLQRARTFVAPRYLPGGRRRWRLEDVERWEAEHLRAAGEVAP